jgi:DNA-3-methyladenine glycosylase
MTLGREATLARVAKPRAGRVLAQAFYRRDPREVAPALLNKLLVAADGRSGRIVEVEAYCGAFDPAAHSYRGETPRTRSMFGPAGHLYVYFTYGMHWCANIACGDVGEGVGVLLRALEPVAGLEAMRAARPKARTDRDLCRGPARLAQALGITGVHDGLSVRSGPFRVLDDGVPPPEAPTTGPRIGISSAVHEPWRWTVPGNRFVSGR